MKYLYLLFLLFSMFLFSTKSAQGQTATTTIQYSGFLSCGGCAVCGGDYWCVNTPNSYCGNTVPCQAKTFFDPVPSGKIITDVRVDYYTASCDGQPIIASINGFALPMGWDGNDGCLCSSLPCMMTTQITANYPCGIPNYNYGGNNTFNLCSYGSMCINRAELVFTYVDPDLITPNITASGPLSLCEGETVTLDAGSGYSSYLWNTGASGQTVVVSTTGTYSVTVTSTTGCTTGSSSINVTAASNITPTFSQLGPYCQGESPGNLPTTSTNGITGIWSPTSISTANIGNTTYTFTPNAGQCAINTSMQVTVAPQITPNFAQLGPYCQGQTPNPLPTTSTNGVTGTWSPTTISTANSGTATYTFTPNSSTCNTTASMTIVVNEKPNVSVSSFTEPLCNGNANGSINITITGGTTPYTNLWNNGSTNPNLTNIGAGNYQVTVTDNNGCTASTTVTITEPTQLTASITNISNQICTTPGSATLSASGGTAPYTYTWPTNAGGVSGASATALAAGTYTVTINDDNGCSIVRTFDISNSGNVSASVNNINNLNCFGDANGSIEISIINGTLPYNINWGLNNATISNNSYTIQNLAAGNYNITITDANDCEYILSNIQITAPALLQATLESTTNISCNGLSNGAANIVVTGGTAPYNYVWTPSWVSGNNPTNLTSGNYSLNIIDQNSCNTSLNFNISEPDEITTNYTLINPTCHEDNGSALVQVSNGGVPQYQILWQDGNTSFNHNNIPSNTNFYYTITDNNGCTFTDFIFFTQPEKLVLNINANDAICYASATGSATTTITGGTPPYYYLWSNGNTNSNLVHIEAGQYSLTVTDANGCKIIQSINILQPAQISVSANITNIKCFGDNNGAIALNISGGMPNYTCQWSNGSNETLLTELMAGSYSVVITDNSGCVFSNIYTINQPNNSIIMNVEAIHSICFGANDGQLFLSATGGNEPYVFSTESGIYSSNKPTQTNLAPGTYNISVKDANSCMHQSTIAIMEPTKISANLIITHPSCIGNFDGSIYVNVIGGTAPYSFEADGTLYPTPLIDSLTKGKHIITVIDANTCKQELDAVNLKDRDEDCIRIPNAFTPNGDGVNDTWIIENLWLYPKAVVQVFNRWGQEVYDSKENLGDWDGKFKGKLLPTGAYIYVIDLFNGGKSYTGTVTLVK